ncbi:MAG: glycerol-3-phosphate acyltransferase [Dehalococcoidia bacterium]
MHTLVVILGGYGIGSIPIAYLITRALTGRDIRRLGSGNVGVMNTVRQAGLPAGMLVFAGEGSKSAAVYSLGRLLSNNDQRLILVSGVAALIGVNWSVFLGFSGGRGTTFGTFFCAFLAWKIVVLGALVWLAAYLAWRDTFLATRTNILLLPVTVFVATRSWTISTFAMFAGLILLIRHRRETDDRLQIAHQPVAIDDIPPPDQ